MTDPVVDKIIKEFGSIKSRRAPWDSVLDIVSRYIFCSKQSFSSDTETLEFFRHGDLYDDTAALAHNQMVSSLVGALWKNGGRTFRIRKPRNIPDSMQVKKYYEEINHRFVEQMEHTDARFGSAFFEYMREEGAYGTAGIGVFRAKNGSKNVLEFRAFGLRNMWIQEDASGRVNKIFYTVYLTAEQLVNEYGSDVLKINSVKKEFEVFNFDKKFKVLWVIRPRETKKSKAENNLSMPYESVHVLVDEKYILRVSGFKDIPIKVGRFYKNEGEEYGRAPGFSGLTTIVDINSWSEMYLKSSERNMNPPLWLLDDGSFGNGTIDLSPGALTVLDSSSRISSSSPIGAIGTVGELQTALKTIERLSQQVFSHFYVDRLTDLNNSSRMTLGETQIRNELRADLVGPMYSRQMEEVLTPLLRRGLSICDDTGLFGYFEGSKEAAELQNSGVDPLIIPKEVADAKLRGEDVYQIEYISPAQRILRAEELRGAMNVLGVVGTYGPMIPEFPILVQKKMYLRLISELSGVSGEVFLSDEEFEKEWEAYMQAQQQSAQLQQARMGAEIAAKQGSAAQQNAQAMATQGQVAGGANGGQLIL